MPNLAHYSNALFLPYDHDYQIRFRLFVLPSQVGFASATGDHSRVVRSHLQAGEPARAIAVLREQKKPGA